MSRNNVFFLSFIDVSIRRVIIVLSLFLTLTLASVIRTGYRCETKRPHERDYEILSVQLVRDEGSDSSKAEYVIDKMKENCILETVYLQDTFALKIYKRLHDIVAEYRREFDNTKTQYEFFQKSVDNWFPELTEFHIIFIKYLRIKSVHNESAFKNAISSKQEYVKFCMNYLKEFSEENPQMFLKFKIERIIQAYTISKGEDESYLEKIIIESENKGTEIISIVTFYQITVISFAITETIKTLPIQSGPIEHPPQQEFDILKANLNKWYPKTLELNEKFVTFLMTQPNISKDKLSLLNKDRSYYDVFCTSFLIEFEKHNVAELDKALKIVILDYVQTYFKHFSSSIDQICEKLKVLSLQKAPSQPVGKLVYSFDKNIMSEMIRPIIADLTFNVELNSFGKNLNLWYPQSQELNKAFLNFLGTKKISAITLKQINTPEIFINSLKGQLAEFCQKYRKEVSDDIIRMVKLILLNDYKTIAKEHDRIIKEFMKTSLDDLSFLIDIVYNENLLKTIVPKKIEEMDYKFGLNKVEKSIKEWYPESGDFNRRIIDFFSNKKIDISIIQQIDSKDKMSEYLMKNIVELNKEPKIVQEVKQKVEKIVIDSYPHLVEYLTELITAYMSKYSNGTVNWIIDLDNHKTIVNSLEPIIREVGLKDLTKKLNVWYAVSPTMNQKFIDFLKTQCVPNNLIQQCKDVGSFQLIMSEFIKTFVVNNQNEVNTLFIEAVEAYLKGRELKISPEKVVKEVKEKIQKDNSFLLLVIFNQINFGNQMSKIINQIEFEQEKQALLAKIIEWNKDKPRNPKVLEEIVNIMVENGLPMNINNNVELIQILKKPGIKISEAQMTLCKNEIDKVIDQQIMQKYPQHYTIIIHNVKNFFQNSDWYTASYMYDIDGLLKKLTSMNESIDAFVKSYEMLKNLETALNNIFKNNKEFVEMYMKFIRTNFNSNKNFMTIEELQSYVTSPQTLIAENNKHMINFKKQNNAEYQTLLINLVENHLKTTSPTETNKCLDKLKTNKFVENLPIESLTDDKILNKHIKRNLLEIKVKECAPNIKDKISKYLNGEKAPMEMVNYFESNQCIIEEICGRENEIDDSTLKTILQSYKEYSSNQCLDKCPRNLLENTFNEVVAEITDSSFICTFEKLKRTGKFNKSFLLNIINKEKFKSELIQAQPLNSQVLKCN